MISTRLPVAVNATPFGARVASYDTDSPISVPKWPRDRQPRPGGNRRPARNVWVSMGGKGTRRSGALPDDVNTYFAAAYGYLRQNPM